MHRVNVSGCITLSTYIKSVEIYFFMCYNVCDMNIEYYRQAVFGQFKEKFEKIFKFNAEIFHKEVSYKLPISVDTAWEKILNYKNNL